jgi:hypothetical protein
MCAAGSKRAGCLICAAVFVDTVESLVDRHSPAGAPILSPKPGKINACGASD